MSNALAIAAVTATLRNLLTSGLTADADLADATVSMQPLDRARVNGNVANQLNVFLYHVLPSATWRNMDMPGQLRQGEVGQPPLGLNLYYLLTAFGRDNDTQGPFSHQLMGRAMSILADHPLLGADEIKAALPNNDLWMQVERVRLTLQPFSVEEIAKLWTGFQTQYRLSVAYEAAVVLIESERPARTALPVLMRGKDDSGIIALAGLMPLLPTLESIAAPGAGPSASLGDKITFVGQKLAGDQVTAIFNHPRLGVSVTAAGAAGASSDQVVVTVPNQPANLPAGIYNVSLVISHKGESDPDITNELALGIAPKITSKLPPVKRVQGNATLKMTCSPQVRPEQRVSLLLGSSEIPADARTTTTDQLAFHIPAPAPGSYFVRLRVDGVDSQLIDRSGTRPAFDAKQRVVIT